VAILVFFGITWERVHGITIPSLPSFTWLIAALFLFTTSIGLSAYGIVKQRQLSNPAIASAPQASQETLKQQSPVGQTASVPNRPEPLQTVPALTRIRPRIGMIRQDYDEHGETFLDATGYTGALLGALAPFRINPEAGIKQDLYLSARTNYVRDNSIIHRVDYAMWVGEDFNSATVGLRDTRELILAIQHEKSFLAPQDNRHSVSKSQEMTVEEIKVTATPMLQSSQNGWASSGVILTSSRLTLLRFTK